MNLKGRNAVVTGGGRGIGAAVARALSRAGARVAVTARTRSEIAKVASGLSGAVAIPCDVSKESSVKRMAAEAKRRLGRIDLLVNNAGIAVSSPVLSLTLADWNRHLAVNATGAFLCTRAFLPDMLKAKRGRVVNVASVAAKTGGPYIAAYAASKHAVLGFTRSAAAELAARGVTVNAVCPGYVDTDLTAETLRNISAKTGMSRREALKAVLKENPQGRLISPEEVASLVLWLCSDEAAGVNGQALVMDGGEVRT